MPEIFPFVTVLHCEVVLRSKEGQSEDIEMTPDEADRVASLLRATVKGALDGWYGAWNHCDHLETTCTVQLSGNADVEIVSCIVSSSPGERQVILRHKDGESQDIVLTPIEVDQIADQLRAAAAAARTAVR